LIFIPTGRIFQQKKINQKAKFAIIKKEAVFLLPLSFLNLVPLPFLAWLFILTILAHKAND